MTKSLSIEIITEIWKVGELEVVDVSAAWGI